MVTKKTRVIIVNTFYQLIEAIHLKNTLFYDDKIYCILSDHSNNAEKIYNKLVGSEVFDKIFFVHSKEYNDHSTIINKICALSYLIGLKPKMIKNIKIVDKVDEIIHFNGGYVASSLYNVLSKKNINLVESRMDEGILSINCIDSLYTLSKKKKIAYAIRNAFNLPNSINMKGMLYTMYPLYYNGILNKKEFPQISKNSKTIKDIRYVFNVSDKILNYDAKYIFFTSVYDFEGENAIGEYELVCKVANLVGKDNLLIKMHPRDTRTIYLENGFNVDLNSNIPWEAIQTSFDFSNKVFLTVNSGSVLSASTLSKDPIKIFFLFNFCDFSKNTLCKKNIENITIVLNTYFIKDSFENIKIAERLEEIL